MPADNELSEILNRRQNLNDGLDVQRRSAKISVYTEFSEFSGNKSKTMKLNSNRKYIIIFMTS